jgi:hypothetical protein
VASLALLSAAPFFGSLDQWFVARYGLTGIAFIEQAELIENLPKRIWEVKIKVLPDDKDYTFFKSTARWPEQKFAPKRLSTGSSVAVRFRRAPRPVVVPDTRQRT